MNLVSLRNPFLNDGRGLKQYTDFFKPLRDLHDEFSIVDVIFAHVTVTQIDATLEVRIVRRHVVRADQIVDARAGPAHSSHYVITRLHFSHVWTNRFNLPETFMTNDQEILSGRRLAILSGIDLFVRAIDTDA